MASRHTTHVRHRLPTPPLQPNNPELKNSSVMWWWIRTTPILRINCQCLPSRQALSWWEHWWRRHQCTVGCFDPNWNWSTWNWCKWHTMQKRMNNIFHTASVVIGSIDPAKDSASCIDGTAVRFKKLLLMALSEPPQRCSHWQSYANLVLCPCPSPSEKYQ